MSLTATNASIALQQTRQAFRHLQLPMPKKFEQAIAKTTTYTDGPSLTYDAHACTQAIVTALEAGTDPATDPDVRAHLARQQLQSMRVGELLHQHTEGRKAALLIEHIPDFIAVMGEVVQQADEALQQARQAIPDLNLHDANFVSKLPPEHMTLWGRAREAVGGLERICQVWHLLMMAGGPVQPSAVHRPLMLAALSAEELRALGAQPKPTAPAHAGHRLSLATPQQYAERVAAVQEQQREQAEERARQEDRRLKSGRREPVARPTPSVPTAESA